MNTPGCWVMNKHIQWPLGMIAPQDQRIELDQLRELGYHWRDPYDIVDIFEHEVAEFAGSKYAIAVDSCSHGIFLCLKYLRASGTVTIPARTYVSVPMQILQAGCTVDFEDIDWSGAYQLKPYPIWDMAVRWHSDMYQNGFAVLSFQLKKRVPIGKGGMILTNDSHAHDWLKRARHDGRNLKVPYYQDDVMMGWHYYMTPEDAARGLILLQARKSDFPDSSTQDNYVDLRSFKIFQRQ